ncbi:MAG: DUF3149 domain-containing protein [Lysobacter sp.]|nr:DUF3149 domain-containing protein [Lysobacter sp.]
MKTFGLIAVNFARTQKRILIAAGRRPSEAPHMHPVFEELFAKPVGWMTLGGLGFIVFIGIYLWYFVRKRMKEEGDS